MRATKQAVAEALRTDAAVKELVPATSVYAVERATLPTLPAVEVIAVSSERVGDGPMVKHELSIEVTAAHSTEDGCDVLLDAIVTAIRQRLDAAERQLPPLDDEGALCELHGTRWSVSASSASGIVRGAAISLSVVGIE